MKKVDVKKYYDSIYFNDRNFDFCVIKKDIKNVNIKIKCDKSIIISVPLNFSKKKVKEIVYAKISWIYKKILKLDCLENFKESGNILNGEFVYFLGDKYVINICERDTLEDSLFFSEGILYIKVAKNFLLDDKYILKVYNNFLRNFSYNLFLDIMNRYVNDVFYKYIKKRDFVLKVRKMKSKWGVCRPYSNNITINSLAIKLPFNCIEYIIFHELSHFIYHNHSKDFYNFIDKYMKDYKERIKLINEKYKYII